MLFTAYRRQLWQNFSAREENSMQPSDCLVFFCKQFQWFVA